MLFMVCLPRLSCDELARRARPRALLMRQPEQPNPGTYGGIVRRWLPHSR
jgi:hypothetical protein